MMIFEKTIKGICWNCGNKVPKDRLFHCSDKCQQECKFYNYRPENYKNFEEKNSTTDKTILTSQTAAISTKNVEKEEKVVKTPTHICTHKYNCKTHREICMKIHGYKEIKAGNNDKT